MTKKRRTFDAAYKLQIVNMVRGGLNVAQVATCPVPCDHLPRRSWPLFRARDILRTLILTSEADIQP